MRDRTHNRWFFTWEISRNSSRLCLLIL